MAPTVALKSLTQLCIDKSMAVSTDRFVIGLLSLSSAFPPGYPFNSSICRTIKAKTLSFYRRKSKENHGDKVLVVLFL